MGNEIVTADFFADLARECKRKLILAGYSDPSPAEDEDIVRSYLNVRRRRVPIRPRDVHKAAYSVPHHLVEGEEIFVAKVIAGDDLRPNQSTKLEQSDYEDGMLNDFGIQHFHLGTTEHPRIPSFVARTDPLLFAMVQENDLYCIGYYKHGEWSRTTLLDVVHQNWGLIYMTEYQAATGSSWSPLFLCSFSGFCRNRARPTCSGVAPS